MFDEMFGDDDDDDDDVKNPFSPSEIRGRLNRLCWS